MSTYAIEGSNGLTIDFNDTDYSVLKDELSGFAGYPVEYDTTAPPGHVGEVVNTATILPREIHLHVVIYGDGRAELERKRKLLVEALNPLNGASKLIWTQEDGTSTYLEVMPSDGYPAFDTGTYHNERAWECDIELIAHDPAWQSSEETEVPIIGIRGLFELPFTMDFQIGEVSPYKTIRNEGNVVCPVVIEATGALYEPIVLQNVTTNQTITIRRDILEGESIVIDTSDENLSVIHTDVHGTRTNALHYCSVGSEFWSLEPGDNVIYYHSELEGGATYGTITFRPRWLSK